MVAAKDVSSARMMLAGQGLPKGGETGFALLDKAEGFGVSQFMENTRYQRALEGELARTITSLDGVRSARVHLALPKQSAFIRQRKNPTASVTIDLLPGRWLGDDQVAAVRHIVSAGVPNLDPDNVMVIDQRGRLLTTPGKSADLKISAGQFEYRERIENDYEKRIEEIISPIVGAGAVRAQVSANMDFTVTEKSQEQYDPKTASVRSEHIEEQQSTDSAPASGVPGSLTNQPPAGGVSVTAQNQGLNSGLGQNGEPLQSSRTLIKNYELDKTVSHVRQGGGVVNRLSIAVVVDFMTKKNEQGEVVREALPAEELSRIEALVKRAVGFDAGRGDQVEVVNAPFNDTSIAVEEVAAEAPAFYERPELLSWVKQGLAGLLVLYLLMGVLRPVMRSLAAASRAQQRAQGQVGDVISEDQLTLSGPDSSGAQQRMGGENALPQMTFEDRLNTAKEIANQDPKRVAQVVNNWLVTE